MILSAFLLAAALQGPTDSTFVSPAWLAAHLHERNVVLLHIGTPAGYDSLHIPGAQFLTLREIAAPPGSGPPLELPSPELLQQTLEAHGISNDTRIVLYWGADWVTPTARAYLTFDWAGVGAHTYILDGGMPAWRAAGYPVTAEKPAVRFGAFAVHPRGDIVTTSGVVAAHLRRRGTAIVDARNTVFYDGHDPVNRQIERPGHIPGAVSVPFDSIVDAQDRIKSPAALQALFRNAGVQPGDTALIYCHVGQQGSLVWLGARRAGFVARLYDGSYTEWVTLTQYPVEQRP